jgi:hypothetical protein
VEIEMGSFEVQGIVSAAAGEPLVQMRQLNDNGEVESSFSMPPMEAREVAQNIVEAAANAVCEAAIIAWAKEEDNENMGIMSIDVIRRYRSDKWGLPGNPEDWRPNAE